MSEMYNLNEVCETLRLSKSTVRRMWERGDFPTPLRIGHKLKWRKHTIDMYVAKMEAAND